MLVGVTFIAITIWACVFAQDLLVTVPLYILLLVMLQSYANRYGFLLGGIDFLLYAAVYVHIGLYATAAMAALVSCPTQIITFIRWSKRAYGKCTIFKKLGIKKMLFTVAVWVGAWFLLWTVTSVFKSNYLLYDNTLTLLSLTGSALCILSYIEHIYIQLLSSGISIVLYVQMLPECPIQLTYVIYSVYAAICVVKAIYKTRKIYAKQSAEMLEQSRNNGIQAQGQWYSGDAVPGILR